MPPTLKDVLVSDLEEAEAIALGLLRKRATPRHLAALFAELQRVRTAHEHSQGLAAAVLERLDALDVTLAATLAMKEPVDARLDD